MLAYRLRPFAALLVSCLALVGTAEASPRIQAIWQERAGALAAGDTAKAGALEAQLRAEMVREQLTELEPLAAAAIRMSRQAAPQRAMEDAELAVSLAPSLAAAHLRLAELRLTEAPLEVGAWVGPLAEGLKTSWSQTRERRPILANLAAALILSLFVTGGLGLLILTAARSRSLLHDLSHLSRGHLAPWQWALLLAGGLFAAVSWRWGPASLALPVVASIWYYLRAGERSVIAAWILGLALTPLFAGWVSVHTAWAGSPAELLEAVERRGDPSRLPALRAWAEERGEPEALFALARVHERQGEFEEAEALYERALVLRKGWPEAAINLGNLLFRKGDLDGAAARYQEAIDDDPRSAAAHFNLSKVQYRQTDLLKGQESRRLATELDPSLVARYAIADEEKGGGGGLQLLGASLPDRQIARMAAPSLREEGVGTHVAELLWRPLGLHTAPFAALAFLLVLEFSLFWRQRIGPSRPCGSCGRHVCLRCNPPGDTEEICGPCAHLAGRKGALDTEARLRQEKRARRYRSWRKAYVRFASLLGLGPLVAGRQSEGALLAGGLCFLLLVAFAPPLVPSAHPWPQGVRWLLLAPPALLVYCLALRRGWKGEKQEWD